VPIYYESRQIPIAIEDPDDLARVEEVLEAEEEEAAAKLVTAWAKLEKVVGAPDRLEALADDIAQHYRERAEALVGKADGGRVFAQDRCCAYGSPPREARRRDGGLRDLGPGEPILPAFRASAARRWS
jgi:type I site-specific restriction-modification system R (restriction) subunit